MSFEKLRGALEANGFAVSCFETGEEAAAYLASQLSEETIGIGGCVTAQELGLYEVLGKNNKVIWHWKEPGAQKRCPEFTAYISSVNAIAETGELINIDGGGNRVAATLYGPQKLYYVVGRNKVTPDLALAIDRARNVAAPLNAKRLGRKTPCAADGRCHDCRSPDRICSAFVIQVRPMKAAAHTEVILINRDLGF